MEIIMNRSAIRAVLVTVILAGLAPVLAACNTTAGAGQDVSAAGHAVTRSADDVKNGL
jgi:predicted small secreted protein